MRWKETKPPPFREVIVSYLVPALHPLIQRNNDIQPAVSISLPPPPPPSLSLSLSLSLSMHRCVATALQQKVSSSPLEETSSVANERATGSSPTQRFSMSGKISFLPGMDAPSSLV